MNQMMFYYVIKWEKELELQEQATTVKRGRSADNVRADRIRDEKAGIREKTQPFKEGSRIPQPKSNMCRQSGIHGGVEASCS
jgi:hypothetical protein